MEESQVKELKCRMKGFMSKELYDDDNIFIRFLRARSHNIDATETMLKKHINWRNENKVDSILTDYVPHKYIEAGYFPLTRLGNDIDDVPVSFMHFGNFDCRGMTKSIKTKDLLTYIAFFLETKVAAMNEISEKTGKSVDKWCFIIDFENFSFASATHKPTLEVFAALISLYESNYPERMKTAYLINASYYFSLFWAVLKPFFSPPTVKKIKIFGKTSWQEELLQNISPDVLPAFLGGDRTDTDGDPLCKSSILHGGPVPESFFEYANQTCAAKIPGAKKLIVSRKSKSDVILRVPQPGSTLEWELVVKDRDIGFSLLYKEHGEAVELIPHQRIETSEATESGVYKCEKAGTYIIAFDNTYSWLHSKEIHYTVSVVESHKQDLSE